MTSILTGRGSEHTDDTEEKPRVHPKKREPKREASGRKSNSGEALI